MNNNWKHIELLKTTSSEVSCNNLIVSRSSKWTQLEKSSGENFHNPPKNRRRTCLSHHNKISTLQINKDICNNCGKFGHLFRHCKNPIVSFGCVLFRINNNVREYLMICRKDTLGYIDFIRGKYNLQDYEYITNMFKQMTNLEKKKIMENDFDTLWINLWQNTQTSSTPLYRSEEEISRSKFNKLKCEKMQTLIDNSNKEFTWEFPEWGFPKGRRNYLEGEYECAVRETVEETGFITDHMIRIKNILPFEEVFIGSNYKNYKHKYYLMYTEYDHLTNMENFDDSEVSMMAWKTYADCINSIRHYNVEKINMITRIDNTLQKYWHM
jgi:ADP-ribose pyrophosphatase YjhB (NUDIX family)